LTMSESLTVASPPGWIFHVVGIVSAATPGTRTEKATEALTRLSEGGASRSVLEPHTRVRPGRDARRRHEVGAALVLVVRRQGRVARSAERSGVEGARRAITDVEDEVLGVDVGRRRDAEAHLVQLAGSHHAHSGVHTLDGERRSSAVSVASSGATASSRDCSRRRTWVW
jgi:hypothetical protein